MLKKRVRPKLSIFLASLGFILMFNLALSQPVHAEFFDFLDPVANFKKGLREWFSELATSFATFAFELLGQFITQTTDLSKIPNLNLLIKASQGAAGSILTFFFIKRIVEGLRDQMTGEGEPNFAEIIGSTVVSAALVFATPQIIKVLLYINNITVQWVTSLGINVNIAGSDVLDKFTATGDLSAASLHIIFMSLIWAIAFLIFAVMGAMRYVELGFILIMGPLSATAYTNRSNAYGSYWMEAIPVIFTQIPQILIAYWIIQWSSAGTVWGMVSAIAGALISLRGPTIVRRFIYSSGTGGAVMGASRMYAYKAMMPKVK
jgi:hypothetical protein